MQDKNHFTWTEEGYKNRLYCYVCKANASSTNEVRENGNGCTNCFNYTQAQTDAPEQYSPST